MNTLQSFQSQSAAYWQSATTVFSGVPHRTSPKAGHEPVGVEGFAVGGFGVEVLPFTVFVEVC